MATPSQGLLVMKAEGVIEKRVARKRQAGAARSPLRGGSPVLSLALATLILCLPVEQAATQEIGLAPIEAREVAKGYSAESLKLKSVINDKGETIGRIVDFIF